MNPDVMLRQIDRIETLPTLPNIAIELMLLEYDTPLWKFTQTIEKDQSLASRLLKLANSSFYGFRRSVNNIPEAVMLLGFKSVRNLVLSVSIIEAFSNDKPLPDFDINDFWHHSVAVAVVSRHLAEQLSDPAPDDCFLAGLLHDIGKVVLLQHFHDVFKKIWNQVSADRISFHEAEKTEMSIDHAIIGGHLAEKWHLPFAIVDTIKHHHTLHKNVNNYKLLLVTHTANRIAGAFADHFTGSRTLDLSSLHPDARKLLNPQIESIDQWFPQVSAEIQKACTFLTGHGSEPQDAKVMESV